MRKIINPCGFHCIKVNHLGVKFNEQIVLDDVNLHIHCGSVSYTHLTLPTKLEV